MNKTKLIAALAALAHATRVDIFTALLVAGNDGCPAGDLAAMLGLKPNVASFHLDRLRRAGLVNARRQGRAVIYAARPDVIEEVRQLLGPKLVHLQEG